jgi:hypothetical protein
MKIRPYNEVCQDPTASPLERETSLLAEWNETLRENCSLRNHLTRICQAVSGRMQADEPTPEDRREMFDAWTQASDILANGRGRG